MGLQNIITFFGTELQLADMSLFDIGSKFRQQSISSWV